MIAAARGALRGSGAPGIAPVLCGAAIALLAATVALEPNRTGGASREIGGALALTVLFLAASRGASTARRAALAPRAGVLALLGRAALRAGVDTLLVLLFSSPALAFAWENGATSTELGGIVGASALAAASGVVLGFLISGVGLPVAAAATLAIAISAVALWPAALGWKTAAAVGFPTPDVHLLWIVAMLLGAVALVAAWVPARRRSPQ